MPQANLTFREPQTGERLVAIIGDVPAQQSSSCSSKRSAMRLPDANAITSFPAAWETLDAIVYDPSAMLLDVETIARLLGGGVELFAASNDPPDSTWPWERAGPGYRLVCQLLGPAGVVANEPTYAAMRAWDTGIPAALRRNILLAGIIVALLLLACAVLLSGRCGAGSAWLLVNRHQRAWMWRRQHPPLREAAGAIVVEHDSGLRRSIAGPSLSRTGAAVDIDLTETLRPILIDAKQRSRWDSRCKSQPARSSQLIILRCSPRCRRRSSRARSVRCDRTRHPRTPPRLPRRCDGLPSRSICALAVPTRRRIWIVSGSLAYRGDQETLTKQAASSHWRSANSLDLSTIRCFCSLSLIA